MWKAQRWRCCAGATSFVPVPPKRDRLISGFSETGTLWPLTGMHILGRCKPSSADVRNRGALPPSSSLIEPPDDLYSDSDLERGDQSGRLPGVVEVERR